tara:strand:+ start:3369 stop:5021 length:1653 start_codon:yes stop_codon:yes gene_type:complete
MSTNPTDGEYNYEQEVLDESDAPAAFPIKYYTHLSERHVYKQLSSVDDFIFYSYVWFQPDQYDEERDNGEYKILIRGTTFQHQAGTEDRIIEKFVSHSNTVVFVDCMFRDTGVPFKSNRDLRDCAKWISAIAGRFNGNKDEIYIVNADEDTLHHVNINEQTLALSIDGRTESLVCNYPRTAMMDGELPEDLPDKVKEAMASSDGIADFDVGGGSISNAYNTNFNSGSMRFSQLRTKFGGSDARASQYTRTRRIVAISQNNNVPLPGETWRFSKLRGSVNGVVASCNGNFAHLKARWQVINNDLIYQNANFSKKVIVTGHCGSLDANQPAFRWNATGSGVLQFRVNGRVYGYSGPGGNRNSGNGGNAGYALHVASPIEARSSDWNNRIRGGGGGGGGGGQGGKGGGGGHSGVKRCSGWFCNGSKTKCRKDGGEGGYGGDGGHGGHGAGYKWTGNSWNQRHNGSRTGGNGGGGGSDRAGGKGGSGGDGGYGGDFGYNGNGGGKGQKGKDGGKDEHDCGYRGSREGRGGSNGGGGGICVGTWTSSGNGGIGFI